MQHEASPQHAVCTYTRETGWGGGELMAADAPSEKGLAAKSHATSCGDVTAQ